MHTLATKFQGPKIEHLFNTLSNLLQEEPVPPLTEEAPRTKSSLSPKGDLHMVPRLDGRFKKPPPHKNRRRPSKAHLHQMAEGQSSGEYHS